MKFIMYGTYEGPSWIQVVVPPEDIKKLRAIFPFAPVPMGSSSRRTKTEKDRTRKEDDEDDTDDKTALKALLAGNRYTKELDSGHPSRVEWLERSEVPPTRKARSKMSQTEKDTAKMRSFPTPLMAILCAVGSGSDFAGLDDSLFDVKAHVYDVTRALAKVDVEERDVAQLARSIFKLAIRINKLAQSVARCQKRYLDS